MGNICCVLSAGRISDRSLARPGGSWGVGGGGVPMVAPGQPVLNLTVVIQGTFRKVCVALTAADPIAEPFPVGLPLPIQLEDVGFLRGSLKRTSRLTSHAYHISHIGAEVQAVGQLHQCVKSFLEALCPSQHTYLILSIEWFYYSRE